MKRSVEVGGAIAAGVALGGAIAVVAANARWARATTQAVARIAGGERTAGKTPATFTLDQLEGLPAPVARYFRFALTSGQPRVRTARVRWAGEFRTSREAGWKPFTAIQHFAVDPPGFVWDASVRMAPLVTVRVRDEYSNGIGAMLGKVGALVPVVDQRGTPEMAAGALGRFLAEMVWLPTALLPNTHVSWTPIDDSTARATLTDGVVAVHADFHFGRIGEIVAISMERYRDVNGHGVLTPFDARLHSDYRRIDGMMVPSAGEVAWLLPDGRLDYWRGRLVAITYDANR